MSAYTHSPTHFTKSSGYQQVVSWLQAKGWQPFAYQEAAWEAIHNRQSGLVNAPTGYGKTFSIFLGAIIRFINTQERTGMKPAQRGLQLLWITPLRALAKDIGRAMEEVLEEMKIPWTVGIRNGDTSAQERTRQKKHLPEILIITPESLHLLLASKNYAEIFQHLAVIAVDEWHELLGSKRGVQVELALSRILQRAKKQSLPLPSLWGISATIGNLQEAKEVLLSAAGTEGILIQPQFRKSIQIDSVYPDEIEKYPWAGHLGLKLIRKILPILERSQTTLIFINTRGMSELWYQQLLSEAPELAGAIALHHGSIDRELRTWVEEQLHLGKLKAVVTTASLDLGVDFRPVETVIQVGSPKGVARFLQRAGRSGHQPEAVSRIYFLPTHSLELLEAAALKEALEQQVMESRPPLQLCYDVLTQYCCTLAISDGFEEKELYEELRSTYCFRELSREDWLSILNQLTSGGNALQQYDEFRKVERVDHLYLIQSRKLAMRHRMHIGTIVSDAMLKVKQLNGRYVGVIEEYFISRLDPGDTFTLAGRNWELITIKDMTALARPSRSKTTQVPSWMGGRMPLSANLGKLLRQQLNYFQGNEPATLAPELQALQPLIDLQRRLSHIPADRELLIEHIETKDGFHLFVYPFEGRLVHEALAALLAYRISHRQPITFSFAMNDYGFELLSDQPIPVDDSNVDELFSTENLLADLQRSVNATEMARRKFRDIAVIGGLIFQGYPGEPKKARHLQSSASLLFKVFAEYDADNLLLRQAYQEVFDQQMEEVRLRDLLQRIQHSRIVITFPEKLTPFCFPIKVDSLREDLSSEKLEDRVKKMQWQLEEE